MIRRDPTPRQLLQAGVSLSGAMLSSDKPRIVRRDGFWVRIPASNVNFAHLNHEARIWCQEQNRRAEQCSSSA